MDPITAAALDDIARAARARDLLFIVVGATARDIVLWHVHGIRTSRATRDLDFAVAVRDWPQFNELVAALVATGRFATVAGKPHHLQYMTGLGSPLLPVDMLPFGAVETPQGRVPWPPAGDVQLNMIGFDDACRAALEVEIGAGSVVPVVSIPVLSALKLLAWLDRQRRNASKDAEDFMEILLNYERAGNFDRLSAGDAQEILVAAEFEAEGAGAQLLGYDLARLASPRLIAEIERILDDADTRWQLTVRMAASSALRGRPEPVELARELLDRYTLGLRMERIT